MSSLLQVGMSQGAAVPAMLQWLIAVGVLVYLLYKVYQAEEESFQNLLSGTSALLVVFVLLALANIPAETLTAFGPLKGAMEIVVTIVRSVFLGAFFAVLGSWSHKIIKAEQAQPGL